MTKDKLAGLQICRDPLPHLVVERGPDEKGVGSWVPEMKHKYVAEYLHATRHAWKKWPTRVLLDPFCGPGRINVRGEGITRPGGTLVACKQMHANGVPFTHVFVGDKSPDRTHACQKRLDAAGFPATAFVGAASETVPKMVAAVPRGALCYAYIDPYNLELLGFDLLQEVAKLKVDITVHFSTMDLHRNVEFEFDPKRARFDDTAPGWRDELPVNELSKRDLPVAFFRYWLELVQDLGFQYSKEMPLVPNDSGHPIYRLVFFANHDLPLRIWADIAKGPQRDMFS